MTRSMKPCLLLLIAATAVTWLVGVNTSHATTLEVGGLAKGSSVSLEASLTAGGTTAIQDTSGFSGDTCSEWSMKAGSISPFTGTTVTAPISTMSVAGCSHKTTVLAPGTMHIAWTSGTNGAISISGSEVTLESTIFGTSCIAKTGTGTAMGTLTGVAGGSGTWDIKAVVPMGFCGEMVLAGSAIVTNPSGLGVVS